MQRVHRAAETSGGGLGQASMLRERMLSRRVAQAFAEILPGLAVQLRRHGEMLGRAVRIGANLAEILASLARAGNGGIPSPQGAIGKRYH